MWEPKPVQITVVSDFNIILEIFSTQLPLGHQAFQCLVRVAMEDQAL